MKGYNLVRENKCYTADSLQRKEAKVIIIPLVRTSTPGFLSVLNRMNVLLTRTSKIMIIVTNRKFIYGTASESLVGRLAREGGNSIWVEEQDVKQGRADLPLKESRFVPPST